MTSNLLQNNNNYTNIQGVGWTLVRFRYLSNPVGKGFFYFFFYIFFLFFKLAFPVVDVYPRNQTVLEGRPTTMNCTAKGVPRPTLSWTFDNGELPPDAAISKSSYQSILHLSKTSKGVEGWYTCKAKNKAGLASSNSSLRVLGLF